MIDLLPPLLLGSFLAIVSGLIVRGLIVWAHKQRIFDIPNERSSHVKPTPRGGGLAIVLVTLAAALAVHLLFREWSWSTLLVTLAAWALVAGVSLIDDLRSLPYSFRFGVHALASVMILLVLGQWELVELPIVGMLPLGAAGAVAAFFWLAGLTNAYNFMDGIDGIAGGQAILAGMVWFIAGSMAGTAQIAYLGLALAAASLGFLWYNWMPARIFMGDVGSSFLGLTLASLAVASAEVNPRLAFVGILAVWPFIFDAAFTFLRRAARRENVFAAHRSHLYQRLVILGDSHQHVTLLYLALAAAGGALGLTWLAGISWAAPAVAVLTPLAGLGLWYHVVARERGRALSLRERM